MRSNQRELLQADKRYTRITFPKAGHLYQGHSKANQYNYLEVNVPVPAFAKPVRLISCANMNRAVQGDVVVVEVFSEWKAPAYKVVDQDSTFQNDDAEDSGDEGHEDDDILVREKKAADRPNCRSYQAQLASLRMSYRQYIPNIIQCNVPLFTNSLCDPIPGYFPAFDYEHDRLPLSSGRKSWSPFIGGLHVPIPRGPLQRLAGGLSPNTSHLCRIGHGYSFNICSIPRSIL